MGETAIGDVRTGWLAAIALTLSSLAP